MLNLVMGTSRVNEAQRFSEGTTVERFIKSYRDEDGASVFPGVFG